VKPTAEQAQGTTACGGSLALIGDWEKEVAGELITKGTVKSVERIEYGVRVELGEGRSFVIGLDRELAPPIAVGDEVDVEIRCQAVSRDALDCSGAVLGANGRVIAFNAKTSGTKDWAIERGPLLERRPQEDYGPTSTYGVRITHGGVSVVTPLRGCVELKTPDGTFRVDGTEVEHADPRAPDSGDTESYRVIRVP
jgi:hypothetical protein